MARPVFSALVFIAMLLAAPAAVAQSGLLEKLATDRLAPVQLGAYIAGDKIRFDLFSAQDEFLLRFEDRPEVFVLYSDRTSLSSRTLKYDSGETAIRVAGWGGLTLYTDSQPNGLPAVRLGDAKLPALPAVSLQNIEQIAAKIGEHFARSRHLRIAFTADWNVLETDARLRAMALDAMQNAARALDRFTGNPISRDTLASRVRGVTLATATRPTLGLHDKTLIVTFNPERGYFGRASSRAIARALAILLPAKKREVAASRR